MDRITLVVEFVSEDNRRLSPLYEYLVETREYVYWVSGDLQDIGINVWTGIVITKKWKE